MSAVALLVAVGIAIAGILVRRYQESEVTKWTVEQAVPVVATVHAETGRFGTADRPAR